MSADILEVLTTFPGIAELGHGYVDRVDGRQLQLPLRSALPIHAQVRFVVLLEDGIPAFAGVGRVAQVSDRGAALAERYETLLDALGFDERSLPVYEYIVAVRQMVYSDPALGAGAAAPLDGEPSGVYAQDDVASEITANFSLGSLDSPPPPLDVQASLSAEAGLEDLTVFKELPQALAEDEVLARAAAASQSSQPVPVQTAQQAAAVPSVPSVPLPTGILTRPAAATQWLPSAVPPQPQAKRSSLFQTQPGRLQTPAAPPRPALDRSRWVERALSPDTGV
jgi:hypothetical protein